MHKTGLISRKNLIALSLVLATCTMQASAFGFFEGISKGYSVIKGASKGLLGYDTYMSPVKFYHCEEHVNEGALVLNYDSVGGA